MSQTATVFGSVVDYDTREPIELATIYISNSNVVESDLDGLYRIEVPSAEDLTLSISRVGYQDASIQLSPMPSGAKRNINFKLISTSNNLEIVITESKIEDVGMVREEVVELKKIPSTTGNFESILPHIALGASSGSGGELSSQYNVRGGNYDENLVYVNDFEIFRPQLIRSGQQEGLTFPNIDMIRDLSFSSGGFESKYGDKMSSVLDIRYKRPEEHKASVGVSLLGASLHLEGSKRVGANAYNKLRYLVGARYKTNRYLLSSLDTEGEYTPNFSDIQAYITYDLTKDLQLGVIGNYNYSQYNFTPVSRSTALGLIDFALQLSTAYDGQEEDQFINGMGGVSLTYVPERDKNPLFVKLLASRYSSNEIEKFDILGFYRLAQINTDLGSDNVGEEIAVLGVGTQHNFARNYLFNTISNVHLKGGIELQNDENDNSHFIQYGVKYQHETFDDELNEWERIDSAGYSIPYTGNDIVLNSVLKSRNILSNDRVEAYLQNSYTYNDAESHELRMTAGVRAAYRSLNKETLISPRAEILYKPLGWKREVAFKLGGGLYYQPPFYREMRRLDGTVNTDLKSQKSIHLIGGISYDYYWESISKKPFKLIAEMYYKKMDNLVSYEVDNVRIRYSGENDATGTAMGLDLRINGEFVPGAESWVNLSLLRVRESLNDVQHLKREIGASESQEVADVPRPTDRFMNLSMFFQDYLPSNENFKMHLNFSVGTGLPFGLKDNNEVYRNTYRYKAYHRVDLGFAYQLWDNAWKEKKPKHPLRFAEKAWLSLEVFNLMDVRNVASNTWIKTITNQQFAIPNYLSSRRINLRLKMDF